MLSELAKAIGITCDIPEYLYPIYDSINDEEPFYSVEYLINTQNEFSLFSESDFEAVKLGLLDLYENKNLLKWAKLTVKYLEKCENENDVEKMPMPNTDGSPAGDMICLLPMIPFIYSAVEKYVAKGFSREAAIKEMRVFSACMQNMKSEIGRPSYSKRYFAWASRYLFATIFRCGVLNFEVRTFGDPIILLENRKTGERELLMREGSFHRSGLILDNPALSDTEGAFCSHFTETDTEYIGCSAKNGYALPLRKLYPKSEWKQIFAKGNKAVSLHIPRGVDVSPETVKETVREGMKIVRERYDKSIRFAYCRSWLLSPNISMCLNENSKIISFSNIFNRYPIPSTGKELMTFLFGINPENIEDLPETTSLQRKVKEVYLNGGYIYAGAGIITDEEYYKE